MSFTSNLQNDENKLTRKEASVRRARLKSISLDSEGARLCTDSSLPVEELIERTLPQSTFHDAEDTPPFYSPMCGGGDDTPSKHKKCSKNIHRLVLNMSIEDDTLHPPYDLDVPTSSANAKLLTPKTPTLTQTRQKAISLDSDHDQTIAANEFNQTVTHGSCLAKSKPHLKPNFLCVESNASASVPTTPKRHPMAKCSLTKALHGGIKCGKTITMPHKGDSRTSERIGPGTSVFFPMDCNVNEKRCADSSAINTDEIDESNVYDQYDDACDIDAEHMGSFGTSVDDVDSDMIVDSGSANSLISQYGASGLGNRTSIGSTNTGFKNNMSAAGLSLSSYSLSNFQGSHSSLVSRSNVNICGTSASITSIAASSLQMSHKSHSVFGEQSSTNGNRFFGSSMQPQQQQQHFQRAQSTVKANIQR